MSQSASRSALMARVRQRGTDLEALVARELRAHDVRYRKNVRDLPGSPDFANKRRRLAIFVHGCFWHGHTACKLAKVPTHNREFWRAKLDANRRRDAAAIRRLRAMGYRVRIVWGCEARVPDAIRRKLRPWLAGAS